LRVAQKHTKTETTSADSDRAKLVGPVSGRVLAGVVFLCFVGLFASSVLPADWMKVAGCIVVLSSGGIILEYSGRSVAERKPHPLYQRGRLPSNNPKLKAFLVVTTLSILIGITSATVRPDGFASPFPFFVAGGFLYLVMPQILARQAIKEFDSQLTQDQDDGAGKVRRKRKKKKHMHKKH
jgi:uncharacterized membrane protein YfcA